MNHHPLLHLARAFLFLTAALLALFVQGCASNGYISSSITTGIGLDVSENSQTQIPHVRFGYIRHGLYYIPTGATTNGGGKVTDTPHVVSKIHVKSEFLKTMEITEKFAVGDKASDSQAARQLFAEPSAGTTERNVQPKLAGSDSGRGADVRAERTKQAMGQKVINPTVDASLFHTSVNNQETNQNREENDVAFSKLLSGIARKFPDRQTNPAVLTPAYQAVLDDPVLKKNPLPPTTPDLISLTDTFQDPKTTTEQRGSMMIAAKNEADALSKKKR